MDGITVPPSPVHSVDTTPTELPCSPPSTVVHFSCSVEATLFPQYQNLGSQKTSTRPPTPIYVPVARMGDTRETDKFGQEHL